MTSTVFAVPAGMTARQVNRAIREAIDSALAQWGDTYSAPAPIAGGKIVRDERLDRRERPGATPSTERRYVHGIGNSLRSTLVAHHIVGSGEVLLCFPNDYAGWDRANLYDRLRVVIWDRLVLGMHGGTRIVDQEVAA